jgi:hypothetical protein
VFRKPQMSNLIFLASPVVDHPYSGTGRETSLTYTVAATTAGRLTIPSATIYINNRLYRSPQLFIDIQQADCFFSDKAQAGMHPLPFNLYKEKESNARFRRTFIYRQLVLIPRSDAAYFYHQMGSTLKVACSIAGIVWAMATGFTWIGGFLLGSLAGGIAANTIYIAARIRPRYAHALRHPLVKRYMDEGYKPWRDPVYGIFAEKYFYILYSLFR